MSKGEADDADQGGDAPVVLQVDRRDREGAFEVAVAAFGDGLALVVPEDLAGAGLVGADVGALPLECTKIRRQARSGLFCPPCAARRPRLP